MPSPNRFSYQPIVYMSISPILSDLSSSTINGGKPRCHRGCFAPTFYDRTTYLRSDTKHALNRKASAAAASCASLHTQTHKSPPLPRPHMKTRTHVNMNVYRPEVAPGGRCAIVYIVGYKMACVPPPHSISPVWLGRCDGGRMQSNFRDKIAPLLPLGATFTYGRRKSVIFWMCVMVFDQNHTHIRIHIVATKYIWPKPDQICLTASWMQWSSSGGLFGRLVCFICRPDVVLTTCRHTTQIGIMLSLVLFIDYTESNIRWNHE